MKIYYIFLLIILLSCTTTSTKKIHPKNDLDNKSKANVTLNIGVKSGVCINCKKTD